MKKLFTDEQYAYKAIQANAEEQFLYVHTYTPEGAEEEVAELMIAPEGYYYCYRDNYTDGTLNPNFEDDKIVSLRMEKLAFLKSELEKKYSDPKSTFTFNLPATLKGGTIESEEVDSFTLSAYTTYGGIREALRDMKEVPEVLLSDILITSDGLTILGLNDIIDLAGTPVRRIYAIWLTMVEISSRVTLYARETENKIYTAKTLADLEDIEIDFGQF